MNDDEFIAQLEDCSLAHQFLNHEGHIRVAWIYLSRMDFAKARKQIHKSINNYATAKGMAHIYHVTKTDAWIYLINHCMKKCSQTESFQDFFNNNKTLLDKNALYNFYTKKLLDSDRSREEWVPPDKDRSGEIIPSQKATNL